VHSTEDTRGLSELLTKAKAYRPLAEHLIREISKAIPGAGVSARGSYVSVARTTEFAALAVAARELRLGLALGDDDDGNSVPRGKMTGTLARISHVISLTDARQIDGKLLEAVRKADIAANGP